MRPNKMSGARHILGYAQTLRGGGVERALLRLAGEWHGLGRRVTLVIGDATGPLRRELPAGVEVISLGADDYAALRALPRYAKAVQPDVTFCPGSHYTGVAAWTRWRLGRSCPPIVGKISNAVDRPDFGKLMTLVHATWLRQHPRFLDGVVAMSDASAAQLARTMRLDVKQIAVIPNPPAQPLACAPVPGLPPRYILGVGRLVPQKRWDRLINAIPRLRERVALVLLGEGECRAALEAQAKACGIELFLPGHVADPIGAMSRATMVALPSEFEGVPGVLSEALSVGTPVVATDCSPAVAEIIPSPSLGTIVPRDDAAALVAALNHWLGDVVRPQPVSPPGTDSAKRYLKLFDSLTRA
ncbi:glycosyltransferase [Sphingomonas sp. IC4-52]|uniref:glycosyltransferase n=1 Tax=Sphingomonas sp. IC4-52 TaxID=2887202 RepID=UPI001D0FB460|nr:glycosyltransferase [Sphingomonas sp. IC4-52]MCC2980719.1 glycosyltransferase [Sphingomonas sp. IC4-52]